MRTYLETLREPHVARLLFSQILARFPAGMLSIALFIHVEQTFGEYTAAGFVLAAFGIGQGVAGPLGGRLLSRFGMRGVLTPTMLVCAATLVVIALTTPPLPLLLALALLGGLTVPPIPPAVRTVYPKVVSPGRLPALFTMDATFQEIIWILGPLATTTIAATWSTSGGILASAALLLIGGVWLITSKPIGTVRIPRSSRPMGAVLAEPVVLLMIVASFLTIGSWGALDAAAIARFGHESPLVGIMLGIGAVGSVIGGVITGSRPMRRTSLAARSAVAALGAVLGLLFIDEPALLWIGYFLAGAACAPFFALTNAAVSATVRFSDTAEAFGWLGTSMLIGTAVSSALSGIAIDAYGARGSMAVAVGFVVLGLLLALCTVRIVPDLGHDLTPRADTAPIDLPAAVENPSQG